MRTLIALVFSAVVMLSASAGYNPFVDGALADVCVKVVDDRGEPVNDALVSVVFMTDAQKADVSDGRTDAKGVYSAARNCIGEMRLWVRKDGYYEFVNKKVGEFRTLTADEVQRERRWSKDTVVIPVTLKRICNPVSLTHNQVDFKRFPATNEVVKLDLETLEWCPPYGNGKHDDLHLVFDGWRNPDDWFDSHEHLIVSLPNCVDGFYRMKHDAQSGLPYSYGADTNAVYLKSLEFRHQRKATGIVESVRPADDEYLVYRVRTQTNELGQITHAHYGRIGEKFSQYVGLSIKTWFNPNDNDPNLEDKTTADAQRPKIRNEKHGMPAAGGTR